jgi:hypothetical protein
MSRSPWLQIRIRRSSGKGRVGREGLAVAPRQRHAERVECPLRRFEADPVAVRRGGAAHRADMTLVPCFGSAKARAGAPCPIVPVCGLQGVLSETLQAFMAVSNRYTLTDLLQA